MKDREPKKRPAIKQHRSDLLVDPKYPKNRTEVGKKVYLSILAEQDFNQELKEFLHNEYQQQQDDTSNP